MTGKTKLRYIVDDVDSAVDFYTGHLGFEVKMRPAPGFAALKRDGLLLFLNAPGAGGAGQSMPDGRKPAPGGWSRFQVEVDDLEAMVEQLKAAGVAFRNEIVEGQGGKQILLEDPAGNPVELFEPKKRSVEPVPEGYHTITPFLLSDDAEALIDFLRAAFDGEITYMMKSDDGVVRHSTVRIGDSLVMVSSGTERYASRPSMLHLYVEDVDSVYKQAIKAGGTSLREPVNEFYGDRTAAVRDDWDNQWWIASRIEEVSADEMKRREREFRKHLERHTAAQ